MKVCFTGGGTGGHVFPVFAIDTQLAMRLQAVDEPYERFWMGSGLAHERGWVEAAGIPYRAISSGKLRRYFSWKLVPDMVHVVIGFFQALAILRREQPDVLFSKGGYVSVPPVFAASILNIPTITHESDALPGLATRINARFADVICLPFEGVKQHLPKNITGKTVVTGVPTRLSRVSADKERAYLRFGIPKGRPLIVVLGGSQGALQVNRMVWERLDALVSIGEVFHQTGEKTYREIDREGYHATPFVAEGFEDLLAAATVVVSRAGATAIADFLEMEIPMVLVPLGNGASRGEQMENAGRLADKGAALVLRGADAEGAVLVSMVDKIVNDREFRHGMMQAARSIRTPDAAALIASLVVDRVDDAKKRRYNNG